MKRLLIRHYKTVHKRMPTRDMVQAKGDKVSVARTTIEKIYVNNDRGNVEKLHSIKMLTIYVSFSNSTHGYVRKVSFRM